MPFSSRYLAGLVATLSSAAIVLRFALADRTPPVRCPAGLVASGPRCCGEGQHLAGDRCVGPIARCGPLARPTGKTDTDGCLVANARIELAGGELPRGAVDWQVGLGAAGTRVPAFAIDREEVTTARFEECVLSDVCAPRPGHKAEPGLPVTGVEPAEAERFCRFVGGHLPNAAEWRFAASGPEARRFPWGSTGLVCRRAAFGLADGPCGEGATGPDLAGARPDGKSPQGVLDLSGNVAEWARDPDGKYRARGGSYRSRSAAELVTAAVERAPPNAVHVGFRCAYPKRTRAK